MKFLLDTNFLLIPGDKKIDVFEELMKFGKPELYTLDLVIRELEKLTKGRGKDSRNARVALELIKKKNIKILKTKSEDTDAEMERIAVEEEFTVCTVDMALARRLKWEELRVVILRSGKTLEYYRM